MTIPPPPKKLSIGTTPAQTQAKGEIHRPSDTKAM